MPHYVISPAAKRDIESILAWTQERFGIQGRLRYQSLLFHAMADLAADPSRFGSLSRGEIAPSARTYHLRHSRDRAATGNRVRSPRHFLLYRVRDDGCVEIGRVLHECMDLARHLSDEYRPEP